MSAEHFSRAAGCKRHFLWHVHTHDLHDGFWREKSRLDNHESENKGAMLLRSDKLPRPAAQRIPVESEENAAPTSPGAAIHSTLEL